MRFPQCFGSVEFLDSISAHKVNEPILDYASATLTHDMQSARTIADKIAMIHDGKIISIGPAGQTNTPHNKFVHQFIHNQIEISSENKK